MKQYLAREDRKDQIVTRIMVSNVAGYFTMLDIARMVGLKKSAHLRGLLDELEREEVLSITAEWSDRYRCDVLYYRIRTAWFDAHLDTFAPELRMQIKEQQKLPF